MNLSLRDMHIAMRVEELALSMGAFNAKSEQLFPSNVEEMELYRTRSLEYFTKIVEDRKVLHKAAQVSWKIAQEKKTAAALLKKEAETDASASV